MLSSLEFAIWFVVLAALVLVVASIRKRFTAAFEYVWSTLRVHLKIVWSSLQILSQFPSLLAAIIPRTLNAICELLWFANISPLENLGLSCFSKSVSGFSPKLLFATTTPIVPTPRERKSKSGRDGASAGSGTWATRAS